MKNKIDITHIDLPAIKEKSLCALPWLHMHLTPDHHIMPCCIANMEHCRDISSTKENNLNDWINSDAMNALRLTMLAGEQPNNCKTCYMQEEVNMESFRKTTLREYEEFLEENIASTNTDGSIDNFKMRYLDMRFSNLCNMKCRTCCSAYSSQWEIEDAKEGIKYNHYKNEVNTDTIFSDLMQQIPNLKKAYFAGGEPLITEDHYVLLEEMLRKGRKDIFLIYNTNISKLRYKDKDLMGLWKQFEHKVEVYASLDHFGKKAECIRHGTKWDEVFENYKTLLHSDAANLNITTSVSLLNYPSLTDFFDYLIDQDLAPWSVKNNNGAWQLNPVYQPAELSFHTLPSDLKNSIAEQHQEYSKKLENLAKISKHGHQAELLISQLKQMADLAKTADNWEVNKDRFLDETKKIDRRRGENFVDIFPELANLYNPHLENLSR